jgi:large subunit ribosomal protein L23
MAIWDRFKKKEEAPGKASVANQVNQQSEPKKAAKSSDTKAPVTKKKEVKTAPKVTSATRLATRTLLQPIVTEKTASLSDANVITFAVHPKANRVAVRQAFRELYKVTPSKVNIINVRGKSVRFGRVRGKRQDYKKALITIPKGTRVDVFEGV